MKRTGSFMSNSDKKPRSKPTALSAGNTPPIQQQLPQKKLRILLPSSLESQVQQPIQQQQPILQLSPKQRLSISLLSRQPIEQLSHIQRKEERLTKELEKIQQHLKHIKKQINLIQKQTPSAILGEKQLVELQKKLEMEEEIIKFRLE